MTSVSSPTPRTAARARRHDTPSSRSRRRTAVGHRGRERSSLRRGRVLARYVDLRGSARELVARPGAGGSVLVLDRDADTREDGRLVAHLAPDEPPANADLASRSYLEQARRGRCRCRPLTGEDLVAVPFAGDGEDGVCGGDRPGGAGRLAEPLVDADGRRYRIASLRTGMTIPELRWCRGGAGARHEPADSLEPVSVREAIAALERYEPICAQTTRAIGRHRTGGAVSVAVLRAELARVRESPIVLNRALRQAALAAIERDGLSMSEIAMRCGRIKRDATGNESGETSWLARRLGLLPEGGRDTPTRWIHSDVLALIAREGLGLSPCEVEAG